MAKYLTRGYDDTAAAYGMIVLDESGTVDGVLTTSQALIDFTADEYNVNFLTELADGTLYFYAYGTPISPYVAGDIVGFNLAGVPTVLFNVPAMMESLFPGSGTNFSLFPTATHLFLTTFDNLRLFRLPWSDPLSVAEYPGSAWGNTVDAIGFKGDKLYRRKATAPYAITEDDLVNPPVTLISTGGSDIGERAYAHLEADLLYFFGSAPGVGYRAEVVSAGSGTRTVFSPGDYAIFTYESTTRSPDGGLASFSSIFGSLLFYPAATPTTLVEARLSSEIYSPQGFVLTQHRAGGAPPEPPTCFWTDQVNVVEDC